MSVRVRYAPSPTGSPHVGNIRTALFCHLLAWRHGGTNILRIEDTDRARFVPGCEEEQIESLNWLGIRWEEGPDKGGPHAPYRQSERAGLGIYERHARTLLEGGHAYWAFDTPQELEAMREYQQINKQPIGYFGGSWRDANVAEVEKARAAGLPGVVRLRMPRERKIVIQDAIRGRIEWDADVVDDPVLIKADGMPTYHCAAMVDDHLMEITHVIRGEEWISSAPKHVWLFEALGWEPPLFVHVPVIKGKDGAKLSKRHGDTRCLDYRAAGYLPEALANFIALIGWSPGGDREVMSMEEMERAFDLDGLQPSPGVFDLEKLVWMNGHYLRALPPAEFVSRVEGYATTDEAASYAEAHGGTRALDRLRAGFAEGRDYLAPGIELEQERVKTLAEVAGAVEFFLMDEPEYDPAAAEKWLTQPHVPDLFEWVLARLPADDFEALARAYAAERGLEKLGPVVHPLRVALTGKTVGPGLFELMTVLGSDRVASRLRRALSTCTSAS